VGRPEGERGHLVDVGVDVSIVFRRIFKKCDVGAWTSLMWLVIGHFVCSCECGNEPSCSLKCIS